jgi:hypothetical protein
MCEGIHTPVSLRLREQRSSHLKGGRMPYRRVVELQNCVGQLPRANLSFCLGLPGNLLLAVICKDLDHAAFSNPATGALGDHALQLGL